MKPPGADRVIVVGAGMGGLAAAIDLAASGVEVLLLERSATPGGKLRREQVDGLAIDAGPTVFTMKSVFDALFEAAGSRFDDAVTPCPLERLARHGWVDGGRLDLYHDVARSAEAIGELSGADDARAYRAFARDAETVFNALDETFMRADNPGFLGLSARLGIGGLRTLLAANPFRSLWTELGRRFRDPRLRQLFGRYATYCGSSPFAAPATLMLISHAERAGVWALDGGMYRLAEAMAALATSVGVTVEYGADVRSLATDGAGVRGVVLADGREERAAAVVFNGDSRALALGLLGAEARQAIPGREGEPRSLSALTWCLRGRVSGFDLDYHTVLFGADYSAEFGHVFDRGGVVPEPTVYLCAPHRAAAATESTDGEPLFLLVNAPATALSQAQLSEARERTLAWLTRHGLNLEVLGEPVLTAPADFAARFPGSDGALYGWPTHGWQGSFRRNGATTTVPGLFLAGGTVHPGPGVPMATLSGRLAAASVRDFIAGR